MFEVQGCQDHHNAGARKVRVHKTLTSFDLTLHFIPLFFCCHATLVQVGASFNLLPGNKNKKGWEDGVFVELMQKKHQVGLALGCCGLSYEFKTGLGWNSHNCLGIWEGASFLDLIQNIATQKQRRT